MWEVAFKESWVLKNWWFWTVVLEKTLENPLDCREIQPVLGFSPGCSLEGLMLKLKLQYFGHLMWRTDSSEKTLMLGKIEGRRRRTTEDEMVGWHHWLDGHEFEQALGVGDGQGSLVCCSPWGHKELDRTEQLKWTEQRPGNCLEGCWSLLSEEKHIGWCFGLPTSTCCSLRYVFKIFPLWSLYSQLGVWTEVDRSTLSNPTTHS